MGLRSIEYTSDHISFTCIQIMYFDIKLMITKKKKAYSQTYMLNRIKYKKKVKMEKCSDS